MAISSIHAGTNPAAALHKARSEESEQVKGKAALPVAQQASETARDAVDVHAKAGIQGEDRALSAARTALHHAEGLSETRREEILDRIRSGFYNESDTIEKVAEHMADQLQGTKAAE